MANAMTATEAAEKAKYIEFREIQPTVPRKTKQFEIYTLAGNDELLGFVEWFGRWRGFAFRPVTASSTWFEQRCLRDIAAFIEAQNAGHRAALEAARKAEQ